MDWVVAIVCLLAVAALILGAFFAARSPSFWFGMLGAALRALKPQLVRIALPKIRLPKFKPRKIDTKPHPVDKPLPRVIDILGDRMSPELEREWHNCIRRGGKWNHMKKRCE